MHGIRKVGNYGDGLSSYSECMCAGPTISTATRGRSDRHRLPGKPAYWYENPQNRPGHWKQTSSHSALNETPLYTDLFGLGKRVLVMGWQPQARRIKGRWRTSPRARTRRSFWECIRSPSQLPGREVPGTRRFFARPRRRRRQRRRSARRYLHRRLVEQARRRARSVQRPKPSPGVPPANLGEACADMFAYDLDGDGKADILSSSAHKFGIWCYQQRPGNGDNPVFVKTDLFKDLVSETHAMHFVDINGDGLKDLVTGKRWWSHGRNEPGSDKAVDALLVRGQT